MATSADSVSKPAKQAKPASNKPNVFARLGQYFKDVRSEMRRVVWPNRQEVLNSSVVVIVTLLFFVAFTLIVDWGVVEMLHLIRQIGA